MTGLGRTKAAIRHFTKPLADLLERDANEGDTRLLVTGFLCEGLGYDKYEDLTTEHQVKGELADYGVRIDRQLVAFIEVKRCTQKLNMRHLRQVQMYAVNEGIEWTILTNGRVWQVYHLTGGLPLIIDLALEVDLLSDDSLAHKADRLSYLTKEALKRRLLDDLWKAKAATAPKSLAGVLVSGVVVDAVRKEPRRRTPYDGDVVELTRARARRSSAPRPWRPEAVKDVQCVLGAGVRDEQVIVVVGRDGVAADAGLGQGGRDGGHQPDRFQR
jgi:hypothetical protein